MCNGTGNDSVDALLLVEEHVHRLQTRLFGQYETEPHSSSRRDRRVTDSLRGLIGKQAFCC